ncbi:DUF4004 family protein [Christensenella tenuis]|uniref:DUF4004 family protein n=1 Tax=Christensenella tenuis TaxID=2763033 RepID=A0ABR7ECT1_9FIRM|nr:DUF4004 family protein [Christensenella tenuis]MBC5646909.1 DUF4004 family protein [Christensenella tenuis]
MNTATHLISKKDLLLMTGISYGQLYRWKRQGLIPEEWFLKQSAYTGQETFFPREQILSRIQSILELKDKYSFDELADLLSPKASGIEFSWDELKAFPEVNGELVSVLPANRKYTYSDLGFFSALSSLPLSGQARAELAEKALRSQSLHAVKNCAVFSCEEKVHFAFLNSVEGLFLDDGLHLIGVFSLEEETAKIKMKYKKKSTNL